MSNTRIIRYALATACLLCLGSQAIPQQATSIGVGGVPGPNVTVVNTTPIPVNVGNTTPVPVTSCGHSVGCLPFPVTIISDQANPPSTVNIGNTTPIPVTVAGGSQSLPVTIISNPTTPSTVNIGNPAALAQGQRGTPVVFSLSAFKRNYSVPLGTLLIIEYASGQCLFGVDSAGNPSLSPAALRVITGGVEQDHFFALPSPVLTTQKTPILFFGHSVQLYADAGTIVTPPFDVATSSGCIYSFSGRLVTP